jgi:hypothetical protein
VNVGLPAKSGVSGWIYLVIPNVLGLAVYSPRLDGCGNSVRGVNFCRKMIDKFQYSIFDQIINFSRGTCLRCVLGGGAAAAAADIPLSTPPAGPHNEGIPD